MPIRNRLLNTSTDPSPELSAKLRVLDAKAKCLHAEIDLVQEERELVRQMIELEKRKQAMANGRPQPRSLSQVVEQGLLRVGVIEKDELNRTAAAEGHTNPARGIHAILMNFTRHGYITQSGGNITLTSKGRETLSRKAEGSQ